MILTVLIWLTNNMLMWAVLDRIAELVCSARASLRAQRAQAQTAFRGVCASGADLTADTKNAVLAALSSHTSTAFTIDQA